MIISQYQTSIVTKEPVITKKQYDQTESRGLCTRLAYRLANCAKRFGFGVASAGISTPVSTGAVYLAGKVGFIQEIGDQSSMIKELIANLVEVGLRIDSEAVINATCLVEEYIKQINSNFPHNPEFWQTVFSFKVTAFIQICVLPPIIEETLFRGLLQDVSLTRIPKYVIKKIAPGKETVLDTTIAKAARIIFTAALFSATHLENSELLGNSYVRMQLVSTFVGGIAMGILKESKAGLLGAMGSHFANNLSSIAPILWIC